MVARSALVRPIVRLEIFCQKLPEDASPATSAAATPASAEALLAVKKVVRSARPRTLRPPRGSAAEAMIRRHGMKVSFDINLS